MRFRFTTLISSTLVCLLAACGGIYEHKTEVPEFESQIASKIAIGDTRPKVRSVLGDPLINRPTLGVEVYRVSGRDSGVGWIIAPWVPVPYWGDKVVAVALIVYDEQEKVKDFSSGLWDETQRRFIKSSVDAGGFSFVNTYYKEPATLISPPVNWKDVVAVTAVDEKCSLIFVMGKCPMETILLDGNEVADFPNAGLYCEIVDGAFNRLNHIMYDKLLWVKVKPGMHRVNVRQRGSEFENSFECNPGEAIYTELRGTQVVYDSRYVRRLEGDLYITKGKPDVFLGMGETRFILWHEGSWYGLPNVKYSGSE